MNHDSLKEENNKFHEGQKLQNNTQPSLTNQNYLENQSQQAQRNNLTNQITENKIQSPQKIPTKNIIKLILSTLNIITIVPLIFSFTVIWLIFGALGDKNMYYTVLGGCGIYVVLSAILFIKNLYNVAKYNKVRKKIPSILILCLISFAIMSAYILPNHNPKKRNQTNPYQQLNLTNNKLYEDENIEIKIENITMKYNNMQVNFRLINKSNIYYNFHIHKLKVNDNKEIYFGTQSSSNFSAVNNWVKPNETSNSYLIYIWDDSLSKYNLKKEEIKKLSFQLLIYKSKDGSETSMEQSISDEYYSIELS